MPVPKPVVTWAALVKVSGSESKVMARGSVQGEVGEVGDESKQSTLHTCQSRVTDEVWS